MRWEADRVLATAQEGLGGLGRHHDAGTESLRPTFCSFPCAPGSDLLPPPLTLGGHFVLPEARVEMGNLGLMAAQSFLKL